MFTEVGIVLYNLHMSGGGGGSKEGGVFPVTELQEASHSAVEFVGLVIILIPFLILGPSQSH